MKDSKDIRIQSSAKDSLSSVYRLWWPTTVYGNDSNPNEACTSEITDV